MSSKARPLWKTCNWNSENHPSVNPLLLQIQSTRARPAVLVGRNNHRLMLALLWHLRAWPILILTSDHHNFESLTSSISKLWNPNLYDTYDIKKVLPFGRWKKEKLFECETFSDEDSGEEDSDYEEFVVPKKKQAKRKREANEAAKPKSYRQPPKPHIRIPKKVVPPAMSNKRLPKPLASMDPPVPPLGPPPKRFN